ncbi:hypothetical protein BDF19DRAFT_432451 [Syncephalis fuscata]|nr:hypothetical protein BDF19DRAFT_432451 [Syncephalis fuscata]
MIMYICVLIWTTIFDSIFIYQQVFAIAADDGVLAEQKVTMWLRSPRPSSSNPVINFLLSRPSSSPLAALFRGKNQLPSYQRCTRPLSFLQQQARLQRATFSTFTMAHFPHNTAATETAELLNSAITTILQPSDTFTRELPGDNVLSDGTKIYKNNDVADDNISSNKPNTNADKLLAKLMRTSRQVPNACWSYVRPEQQPNPRLVATSPSALELVGLDTNTATGDLATQVFSGNQLLPNSKPWAHRYAGFQFGHFAGQLGDGRAISIGEFVKNDKRWELQLKGSGRTPYSRFGDGYAVYRSSIREFLCSEAMHALGVPTSRALVLVHTDREVLRETKESGAVVCRAAPSWVRFGSFEIHYYRKEWRELRQLVDYVIRHHFPELIRNSDNNSDHRNVYARWFHEVARRTARMVAAWQSVGYCHGVMNTDNMSILGITIDYGPFAFLDDYDATWVCNHSDTEGRYSFENQPTIAAWNLAHLARCVAHLMAPGTPVTVDNEALIDSLSEVDLTPPSHLNAEENEDMKARMTAASQIANEILGSFEKTFLSFFTERMRAKLGLQTEQPDDLQEIVITLLSQLHNLKIDYTRFFRDLSNTNMQDFNTMLLKHVDKPTNKQLEIWEKWCEAYVFRLKIEQTLIKNIQTEQEVDVDRQARMRAVNPKFILRNWVAQQCIEQAEQGNDECIDELLQLVGTRNAFEEGSENVQSYAGQVPEWGRGIQCSCSS